MDPVEKLDDFPNEILISIFKYLQPSDRRIVSECCSHLLNIWLLDDFIDDRRLVFDKCVLDPEREPLLSFLKSQRKYRHIVFGDVIVRRASEFAEKFGESVTTVELKKSCNYRSFNFLSFLMKFPNLKTVKGEALSPFLRFTDVPKNLDLLAISNKNTDDLPKDDWIETLKDSMVDYFERASKSFCIELNVWLAPEDLMDFNDSQLNKIQKASLNFDEFTHFELPRVKNLKRLRIQIDQYCDENTSKMIDNLEEQCPALEYLSINLYKYLPHRNWNCLKKLKVNLLLDHEVSRLSLFKNLEILNICNVGNCYFVHKAFLNENMKTFILNAWDASCFTCFETMAKSFPELEKFHCGFELTHQHLRELATRTPKLKSLAFRQGQDSSSLAHLPNLTELTLKSLDCGPNTIETWPQMSHLRKFKVSLKLLQVPTVKIFEKMPSVEDLDIECETMDMGDSLLLFFETMANYLKRLKILKLKCRQNKSLDPKVVDVMAENCKYLQYVSFEGSFNTKDEEKAVKKILEKHSSLRCINSVWLK